MGSAPPQLRGRETELALIDEFVQAARELEAIDHATRAGAPVESGRARVLRGRALVQAGDRDGAVGALELAAQELTRIGASGYAQEAQKELRRLGRRTRRFARAATGLAALSEREGAATDA